MLLRKSSPRPKISAQDGRVEEGTNGFAAVQGSSRWLCLIARGVPPVDGQHAGEQLYFMVEVAEDDRARLEGGIHENALPEGTSKGTGWADQKR